MGVLAILQLLIGLGGGIATAFNKAGAADLAEGVSQAVAKLQEVHDQAVTKQELEGLRITPQW